MEFQKRGTPHIHALFWLTQIRSISTKTLSANVPLDDPELAHHVAYTQSSQSDKHNTPIHKSHTQVTDDGKILFSHFPFSNSLRIRPNVKSINLAYSSHVDILTTDGYGFLLQYVSSYVTKMHDDCISEVLYDDNVDDKKRCFSLYRFPQTYRT